MQRTKLLKCIILGLVFIALYFCGAGLAVLKNAYAANSIKNAASQNWGLGFPSEGQPPVANATAAEMKKYDAYYIGDTNKKVIYLTFDAGYENGYTPGILDSLKKHNVHATFFLVGNYIDKCPDLVKRMLEEGHTVANHTYSHPNMSCISSLDAFREELESLENAFEDATGEKLTKYYRPPQGQYSVENLKMAKQLGYKTFFWSLAYVDWNRDKQPSREQAYSKLLGRIHPGAIVLLHSTSRTNCEILDDLLTKWEELGYSFGELKDIAGNDSKE